MKKENSTILSVITLIFLTPQQGLKQSMQSHPLQSRRWPITLLCECVRKQRNGGVQATRVRGTTSHAKQLKENLCQPIQRFYLRLPVASSP